MTRRTWTVEEAFVAFPGVTHVKTGTFYSHGKSDSFMVEIWRRSDNVWFSETGALMMSGRHNNGTYVVSFYMESK